MLVPIEAQLSAEWSVNLSPEFDLLANASGDGHHLATAQLVSLSRALTPALSLSVELWANWDGDPSGHHRQSSFDVGAAWLLSADLQLDGGVNLGLDRQTPDWQAYVWISRRF